MSVQDTPRWGRFGTSVAQPPDSLTGIRAEKCPPMPKIPVILGAGGYVGRIGRLIGTAGREPHASRDLTLVEGALVNDGATDDLLDGSQADEGAVFDLLVVLGDVILLGHDVHGLRGHHLR